MPVNDEESVDWSTVSFEGARRRQRELFKALPLREKLLWLEQMGEVARVFAARRAAREAARGRLPEGRDPAAG
jgi:hypothetical protein